VPAVDNEGAPCDPNAAGVLVSLPNSGDTLTLPGSYRACGYGWADVSPLQASPNPEYKR